MKLAPQRPDVVLATARAAQMAGFYGDSILAYDEYLKLRPPDDPADDIVRRDRALLAGFSRDGLKPGIRDLTAYLEKHPNDAIGHYDLAQLYEREDRSKALAEISAAVRLSPDFEPAHFFRAWLLQKLGREEVSISRSPHYRSAEPRRCPGFRSDGAQLSESREAGRSREGLEGGGASFSR